MHKQDSWRFILSSLMDVSESNKYKRLLFLSKYKIILLSIYVKQVILIYILIIFISAPPGCPYAKQFSILKSLMVKDKISDFIPVPAATDKTFLLVWYLFCAFKESRGQALRHPLEHVLCSKILIFWDKWVPEEPVPMPHAKR